MDESHESGGTGATGKWAVAVLAFVVLSTACSASSPNVPPPRIPHKGLACVAWEDTRTALDRLGGQYPYKLSTIRIVERHAFLTIRFSHQARVSRRLALAGHSVLAVAMTLSKNLSALKPNPVRLDKDRHVVWADHYCEA